MERIIENPGYLHIFEKIVFNMDVQALNRATLINRFWNAYLSNPKFWFKICRNRNLFQDNTGEWMALMNKPMSKLVTKCFVSFFKKRMILDMLEKNQRYKGIEELAEKISSHIYEPHFKFLKLFLKSKQGFIEPSSRSTHKTLAALQIKENAVPKLYLTTLHSDRPDTVKLLTYSDVLLKLVWYMKNANRSHSRDDFQLACFMDDSKQCSLMKFINNNYVIKDDERNLSIRMEYLDDYHEYFSFLHSGLQFQPDGRRKIFQNTFIFSILAPNPNVMAIARTGSTLLHETAKVGAVDLTKCLVGLCKNLHPKDYNRKTPLFYAIKKGHNEVIKLLVPQFSDKINASLPFDINKTTLLHAAARNGEYGIVETVISFYKNLNVLDIHGNTPLAYAVKGGHNKIVKLLIKKYKRMS